MLSIKRGIILILICLAVVAQGDIRLADLDEQVLGAFGNSTELASLRRADSKTFINPDGTKTTMISGGRMHYLDESGIYRDIDLRPVPSETGGMAFENRSNELKSFFPAADAIDNGVILEYKGDRVSIARDFELKILKTDGTEEVKYLESHSPTIHENRVLFDLSPSIRLEYEILVDKVEQNIVIEENPGDVEEIIIAETIELPDDWIIEAMSEGGHLVIKDETGEPVMVFPSPYVFDSGNSHRNPASERAIASYEFENIGGEYALEIHIDGEWLNSRDRVYPVTIDPTVTLYANYIYSTGFIEAFVWDYTYTYHSNYGSYNAEIYVGSLREDMIGWYAVERGWAEFSTGGIPGGADVTNTVLYVNCRTHSVIGGPAFYLQLYEMDIQPSTAGASAVYGDIGTHTMYSGGNYISHSGLYNIDLGTSADADLEAASSWFAVGFKQQNESGSSWCEGAFYGNPSANRPYLVVTYTAGCVTGTWLGITSTAWNTASNWCAGIIPTSSVDVTIPNASTTPYNPTISSSANCRNILIESGGVVNGGSGTLNCYGNWVNNGTMNGASSTVVFSSSASQTISGSSQPNFFNVRLNKPAGTLSLGRNIGVAGKLDVTYGGNPNRLNTGSYKIDFTP